jgi:tetratricopeptide (TPR) repeat protein
MSNSRTAVWVLAASLLPGQGLAWGQSHHHGHHHGHFSGGMPLAFNSNSTYYGGLGLGGPFTFAPALMMFAPGGTMPFFPMAAFGNGVGVAGPWPPPQLRPGLAAPVPNKTRRDSGKAAQLVTIGNRLFRAGNLKRAADRYEQAAKLDPDSAAPRVGLAQIAFVHSEYTQAAEQFRAAIDAEPGWLIKAPDVQATYAEPADFAKQIARLESHLQTNPADRDAWFVLGAQWYLSGRTRQAADIFVRLSDRKPDLALATFLDASTPEAPRK